MRRLLPLCVFLLAPSASGAVLETRFIDGLGRPIAGVRAEVEHKAKTWSATSGDDGRLAIEYDDNTPIEDAWFRVSKAGYGVFLASSLEPVTRLQRNRQHDFDDIAHMPSEARLGALRELLASDLDDLPDSTPTELFVHGEALRAAFRALVNDKHVGQIAIEILATIGRREDMQYVLSNGPAFVDPDAEESDGWENRWAYGVATSLIAPQEEVEWQFLEACASGTSEDLWVDAGAITTLALSPNPRAVVALERAAKANDYRKDWIEQKLAARDRLPALEGDDPVTIANAIAPYLDVGRFDGAGAPRLNAEGDLAQVELTFRNGRDRLGYTAWFAKHDTHWRLTGVRETYQALMPIE